MHIIKIRKNASTDRYRGSKYRRSAIKECQMKGYRSWADENNYGIRWPGTEGIFSAVKRNFGENRVSRCLGRTESRGIPVVLDIQLHQSEGKKGGKNDELRS